MKTIVCGGRSNEDVRLVYRTLNDHKAACQERGDDLLLIDGGCITGVDKLAREWALHHETPHVTHPALWSVHGKKAGPLRNREMLKVWKPHLVIAFRGCLDARRKFYGWPSIARRFADPLNRGEKVLARNFLPINYMHRTELSLRDGFPLGDPDWQGELLEVG